MYRSALTCTAGVALFVTLVATPAAAQLQTIIEKGDPAPIPGATYGVIRRPAVGDGPGATVGFHAKLKNADARRGVFTEDTVAPGDALATDTDLTSPDPDVVLFRQFRRPALEPTGDAVWHAALTASTRGIFRTGKTYVVRNGIRAPLSSGQLSDFYERLTIVGAKDIVFHSGIVDGPVVMGEDVIAGIFRCSGGDGNCYSGTGNLTPLVINTDLIPDRPGRRFCKVAKNVNSSSYGIAFRGQTKMDCLDDTEVARDGIFRMAFGGPIETVALIGEPGPEVIPGSPSTYSRFNSVPAIENDGIVAFEARVRGIPDAAGLFRCDPDPSSDPCPASSPAELLLRDGVVVDSDGTILRRFENISISDAGDIVFQCGVKSSTLRGRAQYVYRAATDTPELIAAKGTLIPGPPARIVSKVGRPAVSPGGRVAFVARTKDEAGRRKLGIYLHE